MDKNLRIPLAISIPELVLAVALSAVVYPIAKRVGEILATRFLPNKTDQ